MKPKLLFCLALVAFHLVAQARPVRAWSDAELNQASDLVVVGQAIQVKDLDETNSLGWSQSESFRARFRGVETTFKASNILEGTPVNDHIVLHHYREVIEWGSPPDGPSLMSFRPGSTNRYILHLIKDGTNRYAPAAGQIDPGLSIIPATAKNDFGSDFAVLAPLADANPSVRHSISVGVPTKLKIERTADTLSVQIDAQSFESTNLMVGANMVLGFDGYLCVYPVGGTRPANAGIRDSDGGSSGGNNGLDFNYGVFFWHAKSDGIPLPGKQYVVEMDLVAFETDIPPQHEWFPHGENYKVLWRRTLKQIVP